MSSLSGAKLGASPRRTRRSKLRAEWRLFRRDGLVKYARVLYRLRRFHRAVDQMREEDRG